MFGSNPNHPPHSYNNRPAHGRNVSLVVVDEGNAAQHSRKAFPDGPTSPAQGHQPIPTVVQPRHGPVTDLQRFAGLSVHPFCRWAFTVYNQAGRAVPNNDFFPDVDNAVYWSETIDAFDRDSRLIHELVLRIANRELGHPAMETIRQNHSMVEMLLYRNYQRHGGIMLPPTAPAVAAMQAYEQTVHEARLEHFQQTCRQLHVDEPNFPRIRFPAWIDPATSPSSPPGQASISRW